MKLPIGEILKALSPINKSTRFEIVNRDPVTRRYLCPECKRLLAEVQAAARECGDNADCPVLGR